MQRLFRLPARFRGNRYLVARQTSPMFWFRLPEDFGASRTDSRARVSPCAVPLTRRFRGKRHHPRCSGNVHDPPFRLPVDFEASDTRPRQRSFAD